IASTGYSAAALILSVGYFILTLQFAIRRDDIRARRLMFGSLICLPMLLLVMVADFIRMTS
ncbi:MAG: hypothetical protein R3C20_10465, partial [Planctomycetaceae bacterium]